MLDVYAILECNTIRFDVMAHTVIIIIAIAGKICIDHISTKNKQFAYLNPMFVNV